MRRPRATIALLSLLPLLGVSACGDDQSAPGTESPAASDQELPPADETPAEPSPTPPPEPTADAPSNPEPASESPTLDSAQAIRAALIAARPSPAAVWALTDPDRGLDLDFNWAVGHFVYTACSTEDLATWREWAREDGLSFYRIAESDPFQCTSDLSLCASCPEDISTCERGSVFELATDGDGRRYLYGVIMAPARSEALWDLTPTTLEGARRARVDLGSAAETGAKCAIRNQLLGGDIDSLWVEHVPGAGAREVRHLEGDEARDFARDLGARFGLSAYCLAENCVAAGDEGELFGVYYRRGRRRRRRPPPAPQLTLVTYGPAACEGCAPEPSAEVRREARRRRRRRRR